MRKFLAVVKHEYKKIVVKWTFLIGTILFPILMACFALVPALIFSIKGEPTRIVIVDPSNKIAPRLKANLSEEKLAERSEKAAKDTDFDIAASQSEQMKRSAKQIVEGFVFIDYNAFGKSSEQIRSELNSKAANDEIDAYLLIPENYNSVGVSYDFLSRKAGDIISGDTLKDALREAVHSQKLSDSSIDETTLKRANAPITINSRSIDETGREKDSEFLWAASFVIGLAIYITLAIYGQVVMGAVVEEKETRIAEILFSSARPFELMLGKLVGVGLAGLTQMGIWLLSILALLGFLAMQADLSPLIKGLPHLTPLMIGYFLIYFLLGYFLYASFFALIASMVSTVQEGGQFSMPITMTMLASFYCMFAVIRDPNSSFSFWISIAPFSAPMSMPVRILAEMPPIWQIGLSIFINAVAIGGMVWVASRVYRIGMLMYGKRATIPEALKWIRRS